MACITAAINGAKSLRFPDSAFIVNIDDFPVCTEGLCPLPVFTMYKKWRGGNIETNEVLMPVSKVHDAMCTAHCWISRNCRLLHSCTPPLNPPITHTRHNTRSQVFNHHYEDMYFFPWDRRRPKAICCACAPSLQCAHIIHHRRCSTTTMKTCTSSPGTGSGRRPSCARASRAAWSPTARARCWQC